MTSRTPRRHRRLALMAAGTVAAMVLVPGTALAQEAPADDVVETLEEMAGSVTGAPGVSGPVPGAPPVPGVPAVPGLPPMPGLPGLPPVPGVPAPPGGSDDDSPGHETEDPQFPDHASGFVGDLNLNDEEILDLVRYDATVEDDGSTHSDATVLGLLGNELIGSKAASGAVTEAGDNLTKGIGEATNGALSLSLLYHDTIATVTDQSSFAGARGGVLALCLLGNKPSTTSSECEGLLAAGAAEGLGLAERDRKTGHTNAASFNELVNVCLGGKRTEDFACEGLLGTQVLHADSESDSRGPATDRGSWLIGLDSGGNALFRLEDPLSLAVPPQCGEPALLCLFLNQGESFLFGNGAASAQEALHLDLLNGTPLDILLELGRAETIVHQEKPKPPEKPKDGAKEPGKDDKDDLAVTGADIAPLLAGAFLLIGMGALTVAATRRRIGKHTI